MARSGSGLVLAGAVALVVAFAAAPSAARNMHRVGGCAGHNQRRLPGHWQGHALQRIAFIDECDPASGGFGALYTIRLDGSGLRRLRTGIFNLAVSPNKAEIAFGDYGGRGGIAVVHPDGSRAKWLSHGGLDSAPAWAPDGRKLVFVRTVSPASSGALFASSLYLVNSDGRGLRRLAGSTVDDPGPSWVDQRRILITAKWGKLAIISARTGGVERLISLPRRGTQAAADSAALAPNHHEIAYVECDNGDCSSTSVDLITLAGKLIERIPGAHTPAWTPKSQLLYACCQQAGIRGNTSEIVMSRAQQGKARTITPSFLSADEPEWLGGH